jgi:hypothetical protein
MKPEFSRYYYYNEVLSLPAYRDPRTRVLISVRTPPPCACRGHGQRALSHEWRCGWQDYRDAYFQSNPFEYDRHDLNGDLMVFGEFPDEPIGKGIHVAFRQAAGDSPRDAARSQPVDSRAQRGLG